MSDNGAMGNGGQGERDTLNDALNGGVDRALVHDHITALRGVVPKAAWGETSYFFNPGQRFERGTYFATIKDHDGVNDHASRLDRPGVWRLNMGVAKPVYFALFGPPPPRPGKGRTIEGDWDFTALDTLMPHPVYGWMGWIAVLNPSPATWARCRPLIESAYERAKATFDKRMKATDR